MAPEPAENLPGEHCDCFVAPMTATWKPGSANQHDVEPLFGCHSPQGQSEHSEAPDPLNVPVGHSTSSDAPSFMMKDPADESTQADEASLGAFVPGIHGEHDVAPELGEIVPGSHAVGLADPASATK